MTELQELWKSYNLIAKLLKDKLNRTANLVGEYAEFLIMEYSSGELLPASNKSADVRGSDGKLYQVKARKLSNSSASSLGVIRTWDFDYLAVVIFDEYGNINNALICPVSVAKEYGKKNELQNGWVISTTKSFLEDDKIIDITSALKQVNIERSRINKTPQKLITQKKKNENEQLPIGAYVRMTFNQLVADNKIGLTEVKKLQELDYSKSTFGIQYPFLKKISGSDQAKIDRYWKTPVIILEHRYFICSEWFESSTNNDRPFYEEWLTQIKQK